MNIRKVGLLNKKTPYVTIPQEMLERAGIKAGDYVRLKCLSGEIIIKKIESDEEKYGLSVDRPSSAVAGEDEVPVSP